MAWAAVPLLRGSVARWVEPQRRIGDVSPFCRRGPDFVALLIAIAYGYVTLVLNVWSDAMPYVPRNGLLAERIRMP